MSLMGEQFGGHNFERARMNTTSFICGCLEKESFNAVIFWVVLQISLLLVLKRYTVLLLLKVL